MAPSGASSGMEMACPIRFMKLSMKVAGDLNSRTPMIGLYLLKCLQTCYCLHQ